MYSLDCQYYRRSFSTLEELLDDIVKTGMDPNYEITYNGELTGELAIEQLIF